MNKETIMVASRSFRECRMLGDILESIGGDKIVKKTKRSDCWEYEFEDKSVRLVPYQNLKIVE